MNFRDVRFKFKIVKKNQARQEIVHVYVANLDRSKELLLINSTV